MCSSGWARVAMERQAKRVCTDVGEEALMDGRCSSRRFHCIAKVGLCNQSLIARAKAATPHHTTPHQNQPLETLCLLGKTIQPTSTA
jgi:hypothetical protein